MRGQFKIKIFQLRRDFSEGRRRGRRRKLEARLFEHAVNNAGIFIYAIYMLYNRARPS